MRANIRMYVSRCIHVESCPGESENIQWRACARTRANELFADFPTCAKRSNVSSRFVFSTFPYVSRISSLLRVHVPTYVNLYVYCIYISYLTRSVSAADLPVASQLFSSRSRKKLVSSLNIRIHIPMCLHHIMRLRISVVRQAQLETVMLITKIPRWISIYVEPIHIWGYIRESNRYTGHL